MLHPLHTKSRGGRPIPEFLANCEEVSVKDIFNLPKVWSSEWGAQLSPVSLIEGCFQIEHDDQVAMKVPLKFAEVAWCHKSEFPSCSTGFAVSSLIAVMPEAKVGPKLHHTEMNEARKLGISHSPGQMEFQRPVWIVLVNANVTKVIESMTLAGAIRTDLFDAYAMSHFMLGKGSFAQVRMARPRQHQKRLGEEHESRQMPEVVAKAFIHASSEQAQHAKDEAAALLAIGSHPNLVSFHGMFASNSDAGKQWTLLLGYCSAGNLLHYLRVLGVFKMSPAKKLARSMLKALAHVHSREYMHRDVKPENVLIDATGRFVLSDCGAAVHISEG